MKSNEADVDEIVGDFGGSLSGMCVLVTGGAGFLGSWLCDILVKFGADVTAIDNLSSGKRENISNLIKSRQFKFIKADVVSTGHVPGSYDLIFHFASPPSPDDYQTRPIDTMLANSIGTLNMLRIAEKKSCPMVFASTSEIYGDARIVPTPEIYWGEVNPVGPRSCHDESKRFAEALCASFRIQRSVDVRVIRLFNSYGPRLGPEGACGKVISKFLFQAMDGQPITVYGDGFQTRSFCYVTDTIRGIIKVATSPVAKNGTFNIGSPDEISIIELARLVRSITGSDSEVVHLPRPMDDPERRCPDISKAREMLGWRPRVDLRIGLGRTLNWIKANYPIKAKQVINA